MDDDEFLGLAYEMSEAVDEYADMTPSESVLMKRHLFPSYTEHLWVQGYPAVRMIVLTFPRVVMGNGQTLPGCVRELPVGWRDMSSAETFSSKLHAYVEQYEREGWKRA